MILILQVFFLARFFIHHCRRYSVLAWTQITSMHWIRTYCIHAGCLCASLCCASVKFSLFLTQSLIPLRNFQFTDGRCFIFTVHENPTCWPPTRAPFTRCYLPVQTLGWISRLSVHFNCSSQAAQNCAIKTNRSLGLNNSQHALCIVSVCVSGRTWMCVHNVWMCFPCSCVFVCGCTSLHGCSYISS